MIEGLRLEIKSDELVTLLSQRVEYHSGKAAWFEKKVAELGPDLKEMDDEAEAIGKYTTAQDPVQSFRTKAKHHRDRATVFRFMVEHVVKDERYVLQESDLARIEVMGRGW